MRADHQHFHKNLIEAFGYSTEDFRVFRRHGMPLLLIPRHDPELAKATIALYAPQTALAKAAKFALLFAASFERAKPAANKPHAGFLLCNREHGFARAVGVRRTADGRMDIVKLAMDADAAPLKAEFAKLRQLADAGVKGVPAAGKEESTKRTYAFSMERVEGESIASVTSYYALELLESWMKDEQVKIGEIMVRKAIVHGDFAPWNLIRTGNGAMAVDWEWADPDGIAGFDLAYGLYREAQLLQKLSGAALDDAVVQKLRESPAAEHIAKTGWKDHEKDLLDMVKCYIESKKANKGDEGRHDSNRGPSGYEPDDQHFIAIEGADGVGKSTVLALMIPKLMESGRWSGYTYFHWKPIAVHRNELPGSDPHDPRAKQPRNFCASLAYLAYHWLTFWRGYFKHVRPAIKRGELVIADRYTYDIMLDPARFRLSLPRWVLRTFIATIPQPSRIIALHASAQTIRARKPELQEDEILAYQKSMLALAPRKLRAIEAENAPGQVADACVEAINPPPPDPGKLRVLLSCYACEPNRGSEPGVGWAWALGMAKRHETYVLTRANNREVIEAELSSLRPAHLPRFIYYDLPSFVRKLKKAGIIPTGIYYFLWQLGARRAFDNSGISVDIIHHVTFCSYVVPGFWYRRKEKVALGPLGGMSITATQYLRCYPLKQRIVEWSRMISRKYIWRFNPFYAASKKNADCVLYTEQANIAKYGRGAKMTEEVLDVAVPPSLDSERQEPFDKENQFVWAGTIEPWKALDIAILAYRNAFGEAKEDERPTLKIFGEGSLRTSFEHMVKQFDLNRNVVFCDGVSQKELWQEIAKSRALVFTSVRDTCGSVNVESLAMGTPIICFNHQGVGALTNDTCAIRIEPASWEESIDGFAKAMKKLAADPELAVSMGKAGKELATSEYTWDAKLGRVSEIYRRFTGGELA